MPNSAADKVALDERTRLFHEVYVPTFSCLALISVTVFIMIVASIEISSGGDDSADANVMFAFASVNAVIDITCITMFYFRKDDIVHNKFPSFSAEPVQRSNTPVSRVDTAPVALATPVRVLRDWCFASAETVAAVARATAKKSI